MVAVRLAHPALRSRICGCSASSTSISTRVVTLPQAPCASLARRALATPPPRTAATHATAAAAQRTRRRSAAAVVGAGVVGAGVLWLAAAARSDRASRPPSSSTTSTTVASTQGLMGRPRLSPAETDALLRRAEHAFAVEHFAQPTPRSMSATVAAALAPLGRLASRARGTDDTASQETTPDTSGETPVVAVHHNQVASNSPIEDYRSETAASRGLVFCVFDGHSGTECAALLSKTMGSYVAAAVDRVGACRDAATRRTQVKEAIRTAFIQLDSDIVGGAFLPNDGSSSTMTPERAAATLRPALAGACALVAYVEGTDLYVAWAGDSRAVLGRERVDGSFETIALSMDHTPSNAEEHARLLREHPGELYTVVSRGRILGGLMPSRAFGDSRYKWSLDTQTALAPLLRFRTMANRNYISPPYVTAEPEVTHYRIDPARDRFLVLGTDGIYDMLSSENVVGLTAQYMRKNHFIRDGPKLDDFSRKGPNWEFKDANAATSLIRNAISRGAPEIVPQLLAVQAPHSRSLRDDMTATVVFFGTKTDPIPVPDSVTEPPNATIERANLNAAAPKKHHLKEIVAALSPPAPKL